MKIRNCFYFSILLLSLFVFTGCPSDDDDDLVTYPPGFVPRVGDAFINIGETVVIDIPDGLEKEGCIITGNDNAGIATAKMAGTKVEITGISRGEIKVHLKDKKGIESFITVKVYRSDEIRFHIYDYTLKINRTTDCYFENKGGNYAAVSNDPSIATAEIEIDNKGIRVKVRGIKAGSTTVEVRNTDTGHWTVLNIKVE